VNELLQLVRDIRDRLGNSASGVSSVEVRDSTRGFDVTVKAYTDSPVEPAGDAAMDEYLRIKLELKARVEQAFSDEVNRLAAKR
jgi:hypothetical protein